MEKLKKVVHMEGLGTIYDKVKRLVALSGYLSDVLGLTTPKEGQKTAYLQGGSGHRYGFEFPELQGSWRVLRPDKQREQDVCRAIRIIICPLFR